MAQELLAYWTFGQNQTISVHPDAAYLLIQVASKLSLQAATETNTNKLRQLSNSLNGALASLTIVSAENYLATATHDLPLATNAILQASLTLESIFDGNNMYRTHLKLVPNIIFAIAFGALCLSQIALLAWSRNWYFAACFIVATGLEFAGYVWRILCVGHEDKTCMFLAQLICLTIAPTFVMAGVYFLLAQLIIAHGGRSSIVKPMWFACFFLAFDLLSLIVQTVGAGVAAGEAQHGDTTKGSKIALAGICIQLFTMTIFIILLFDYYKRSIFNFMLSTPRTTRAFLGVIFATKNSREYLKELDDSYDPRYYKQRNKNPIMFRYLPMAILIGVLFVYIRCIYRVVELSQGIEGVVYRQEVFVMVFDALMVFLTCAIFVLFHPNVVFGLGHEILVRAMKKQAEDARSAEKEERWHAARARELEWQLTEDNN